ncbi:hypothetical protein B0A49_09669, partial [Cryomyces minteri]
MPPKSGRRKKDQETLAPNAPRTPPNWPPLTPLIPTSDLCTNTLVPNQIITIPQLWTSTLCKNYVSFLSTLPLTTTPGKPKKGDAVRVNDRFQVDDAAFAERLWRETGLRDLVLGVDVGADGNENGVDDRTGEEEREKLWGGEVVGLNPNIRVYRYRKGQFFDQH